MFSYVTWHGRRIAFSRSGQEEMEFEGLDLRSLREFLDSSRPSGEKRKPGMEEMIVERGSRSYKIVLVESFQHFSGEIVYLVVHVKSVRRN